MPKPTASPTQERAEHGRTVPTSTYWSVGRGRYSVQMAADHPIEVRAAVDAAAPHDAGADPRRGRGLLRHDRVRGHVAQRHRRRRRHPPAEPAAPLPVQGGAVRRGVRAPALGLVRSPRRRGGGRGARLAEGRAGPARRVRVLRRQPGLRPPGPPGGDRRRRPPRHRPGGRAAPDVRSRRRLLPPGDGGRRLPRAGRRAAPAHRVRRAAELLLRRPVPRGLLDIDPLDPRALEQRLGHVLAFFQAALVP